MQLLFTVSAKLFMTLNLFQAPFVALLCLPPSRRKAADWWYVSKQICSLRAKDSGPTGQQTPVFLPPLSHLFHQTPGTKSP